MPYDHHRKAGNRGDVIKHPALVAALDFVLARQRDAGGDEANKPFHYLDVFAGHAWHPLLDQSNVSGGEKRLEWPDGIGVLHEELWANNELNGHVEKWRNRYLPQIPSLIGGRYPGSSIIAADLCRDHERLCRMTLFDHSDDAQTDLRRSFQTIQPMGLTETEGCEIRRSLVPTEINEESIQSPDFIFIDPPRFDNDPSFPNWRPHFDHILRPRAAESRPTLMWLPASGADHNWQDLHDHRNRPQHDPTTKRANPGLRKKLQECLWEDYHWSAVRWKTGGSGAACIVVYNCAVVGIRRAVECIVAVAGTPWECQHSNTKGH